MKLMRVGLVLAAGLLTAAAYAQELGRDYTRLTLPQTPQTPGKIEVIEFFSFGCPHCADLYPELIAWEAKLPANAVLVKSPVSFGRREWGQLVRAYYALEALGELKRLEGPLFEAIHKQHQPLYTEDAIAKWVAARGVSEQKFRGEFNSFNVSTKSSRADQLSRNYRVNQVPQVVVDGKYIVGGRTHTETLDIAGKLVEKATAERKAGS